MFTKGDLLFIKPCQIAKSEKYETFCVSNFLFGAKNGSSSSITGRIIVVLF